MQKPDPFIDVLIADYGPQELAARNAEAAHVPRHQISPELEALQPWQRALVLTEARKRARQSPRFIAALLTWIGLCTLVWQIGFGGRVEGGAGPIYVLAALVPQILLLNISTRVEARRIAIATRERMRINSGRAA